MLLELLIFRASLTPRPPRSAYRVFDAVSAFEWRAAVLQMSLKVVRLGVAPVDRHFAETSLGSDRVRAALRKTLVVESDGNVTMAAP